MKRQPTILVVDDIRRNIKLLGGVVAPRGYTVLATASGEEALAIASRAEPDLVLLDILMPGMDGYEV